ncbi:DUF892 family protein [Profundibacterium mesophilum]|uniref:Uncharacterized protein n=1 Tax=Profundibacterium mesophilum KAUST100406-0324 TaxID=1037889 RepID=A0A921NRG3_9RHOB|nr:DUF892 family protein [Profundibacterium mesophilum]KAF0674914.1 hypothetical protein PMES_02796 [Profundibacterium mesophilum KAUST100406-0324]
MTEAITTYDIRTFYIGALHALRSASEQGEAAADHLRDKAQTEAVQSAIKDYGTTAKAHSDRIASLLDALGEAPNDFADRIMEGIGNGTQEMMRAAHEGPAIDLAVLRGGRTGVQYLRDGFASQPVMCRSIGLDDQAEVWAGMADEWRELKDRMNAISAGLMDRATSGRSDAA